ncbi:MAG: hypothetical protein KDK23_03595 [Leptospiraceae bacterium]|nr:hypothetical protein [Leptospiraceae bacterium]
MKALRISFLTFIFIALGAVSCQLIGSLTSPEATAISSLSREALLQLPDSNSGCDTFDYFPEGGIRSFYCHIQGVVSYEKARKALPMDIFVSGPHSDSLDLDNNRSFGHYNPEFVTLLVDHGVPGSEDEAFRRLTQPIYDRYVASLARAMFVTYRKFQKNPALLQEEIFALRRALQSGGVPDYYYEKYFYFMNPKFRDNPTADFEYYNENGFDGGYDGNVVKTAAYFWIRRSEDGTDKAFFRGLMKLLQTYDSAYLQL